MEKKIVLVVISIIIVFLLVVAAYNAYSPNSKLQKTADTSPDITVDTTILPEITDEDTTLETIVPPETTSLIEPVETTTADTTEDLPTLELVVYEGPVVVPESDLCYYRVEAKVTGKPYPFVKFSKDDSGGAWGKYKVQVNLKNGESYVLVATAINSIGNVSKTITLTWSQ